MVCRYHSVFIRSPVNGHLDSFHLLTMVTNSARNVGIQESLQVLAFSSFGYIPRSGLIGSCVNSILNSEEPPQCFPQLLYHFTFPPAVHKNSNFSTSSTLAIFWGFLTKAIQMGAKWYLIVVSICISLMVNDVDYLFMGLSAICVSSLEKGVSKSFVHFSIGIICCC